MVAAHGFALADFDELTHRTQSAPLRRHLAPNRIWSILLQVAREAGFESAAHFSRAFRRESGRQN